MIVLCDRVEANSDVLELCCACERRLEKGWTWLVTDAADVVNGERLIHPRALHRMTRGGMWLDKIEHCGIWLEHCLGRRHFDDAVAFGGLAYR